MYLIPATTTTTSWVGALPDRPFRRVFQVGNQVPQEHASGKEGQGWENLFPTV